MKRVYSKKIFFSIGVLILFFVLLSFGILSNLDNLISSKISLIWNPFLNLFFILVSQYIFDTKVICLAVLFLSVLFYKKNKYKSIFLLLVVGITAFFSELIKYILAHPRPLNMLIEESSYGFPSSHSSISLVLFFGLFFLFKDKIKNKNLRFFILAVFIFLILLIGFSRIYLNVHFLSDVLAGYVLGGVVILIGVNIERRRKKTEGRTRAISYKP